MLRRRDVVVAGAVSALAPRAVAAVAVAESALRRGDGVVVLMRHATAPGLGDPSEFAVGDCGTQRNLSAAGRDQALRVGGWYRERGLVPAAVRSSPFCRCADTAALAFADARIDVWPALASFIRSPGDEPAQTAVLRAELARLRAERAPGFQVWVTHMVNVIALAGPNLAQGEAVLVRHDAAARRIETIAFLPER